MSHIFTIAILFGLTLSAQTNTEVFLFDIDTSNGKAVLKNMRNVSNNEGYDNQPSFLHEDLLLFSGNNEGQTDIALYDIASGKRSWLNRKTPGGEYSPQKLPLSDEVAAVRLDTNGLQRLYYYHPETKKIGLVLDDLQVAYYHFYTENDLVSAVLGINELDLVISDIHEKSNDTIVKNVGRSIQGVPYQKYVSYTVINEEKNHDLYIIDMDGDRDSYFVCQLPIGIQDHSWLDEYRIIIGSNSKLYIYDTLEDPNWKEWFSLKDYGINNITRISVSPNGKKIALVGEPKLNDR
jgi:Tol biopolymer transport system component